MKDSKSPPMPYKSLDIKSQYSKIILMNPRSSFIDHDLIFRYLIQELF